MFELIEVLWCLSPLVLIPLCIVRSSQRKKMQNFIEQLFRANRVSWRERCTLTEEPHRRRPPMEDDVRPPYAYGYKPRRPGLDYPGLKENRYSGPVFRDEGRSPVSNGNAPVQGQPAVFTQQAPQARPAAPAPQARPVTPAHQASPVTPVAEQRPAAVKYISPEEQNRLMKERFNKAMGIVEEKSAAEPVSEQPAKAESTETAAPHHHHDGVDLINHSREEQKPAAAAVQPAAAAVQPQPNMGRPPYGQPYGQPNMVQPNMGQPYGQPNMGQPAPYYNRPYPQRAPVRREPKPSFFQRLKDNYSPATLVTGIGMIFVVLAGIIFSTAYWVSMSDWTRVAVLGGQAVLFFILFLVFGKKLKIAGSAAGMYILGSAYTTIAYLTAGYFGLFGAWFGMDGRGMMMFLALGAVLVSLFSAGALKLFKKPFCEYAAAISLTVSGTLLLAQFANYFERNYGAFSFIITAVGLAATAIYLTAKKKGVEIPKAVTLSFNLMRAAYILLAAPLLLIDLDRGNAEFGWSFFGWGVCLMFMGECLWHAVRLKSVKWLYGHMLFIFGGAFSLLISLNSYAMFALIITLFTMTGGWVYTYLKAGDKLSFNADGVYLAVRIIFGAAALPALLIHSYCYEQYITAALWVIDFAVLAAVRKKQLMLAGNCIAVANLVWELFDHADVLTRTGLPYTGKELAALIVIMAGAVCTALYVILEKKGKNLVSAGITTIVMRAVTGIPALMSLPYAKWDAVVWIIFVTIFVELTVYAIVYSSQIALLFQFAVLMVLTGNVIALFGIDTLAEKMEWSMLIMWGICAAGTAVYLILRHLGKARFNANVFVVAMRVITGFTAACLLIICIQGQAWDNICWAICACYAAELLVLAVCMKDQAVLAAHALFLGIMLTEIGKLLGDRSTFSVVVTAFLAAATMVYMTLKHKGKCRVEARYVMIIMRAVFGLTAAVQVLTYLDRWDYDSFAIAAVLAVELLFYGIMLRKDSLTLVHAGFLTLALVKAGQYMDRFDRFILIICGIAAVGTFVYYCLYKAGKLRFEAKNTLVAVRAVFFVMSSMAFLVGLVDANIYSTIAAAVYCIEGLYYGIALKKQSLLGAHAVFLTFGLWQASLFMGAEECFPILCCAVAAAGTAAFYVLARKIKLRFDARMVLAGVRSFYGVISVMMIASGCMKFSWQALTVCGILLAETTVYGILLKDQRILGAQAALLTCGIWQVMDVLAVRTYFPMVCCLVAAAGTFVYFRLSRKEKLSFDADYVLTGVRAVYGIICLIDLFVHWLTFSWPTLVIWAVTAAELTYYAVSTKNRWMMRVQSTGMLVMFGVAANMIGRAVEGAYNYTGLFVLAMFTAAGLVIYRVCRKSLYTRTADCLYNIVLTTLGVVLMEVSALPYGVIAMLMATVFLTISAFDDDHYLSKGLQYVLPLPEIVTAYMLGRYLDRTYDMACGPLAMVICAGVLCAAAFILSFGLGEDRKYSVMKYSTEVGSALAMFMSVSVVRDVAAGAAMIGVSVALFAVIHLSKKNFHAVLPLLTLFRGARLTARAVWYDPMREGSAVIIFSMFATALLALTSRLMFSDKLYRKNENGKFMADIAQFGILLCISSCTRESMMFSGRARLFIALLELTVFTANLIRRSNPAWVNRAFTTAAIAIACIALAVRPFMVFESSMITMKIILAIMVLFGLAVKKIWADNEKLSKEFSQGIFMAAFLMLVADGLMNQSLLNSLIVLSVSLALFIYSFIGKSRRWFIVSAVTLVGLTLYITGDFLATVAWWAYLLIAGILLIVIAAMAEYFRQRAAKHRDEARFFVDWKW